MTRFRKVLLGTAAAVTLGGATLAVTGAGAQVVDGAKAQMAAAHGMRWGGPHRGPGGPGMWCGPSRDAKLDRMIKFGNAFFKFEGAQKTAWNDLTRTLHEASADIGKQCTAMKDQPRATTPTEKLARMEQRLSSRLALLQKVRPVFDKFYGTLSADQKQALDGFMKHRGPGRHGERGEYRGHDRDRDHGEYRHRERERDRG